MRQEKLLFVKPFESSFNESDIKIFAQQYNVVVNYYQWNRKAFLPLFLVLQLIFFLRHISSTNRIVISFGGYWSLIPSLIGRVFGVPVFIILHGTDCASLPNINYGSLRKFWVKKFCELSYKLADKLLPVSNSLVKVENSYLDSSNLDRQGLEYHFPGLLTPYKVIFNGLETDFWVQDNNLEKTPGSFMAVFNKSQFLLKGGDLIFDVAKRFPESTFYIAGISLGDIEVDPPQNVLLLGKLTKEELRNYYSKCRFHLQLSIFEGFGLALCEAMLCNCVPIGSSVNMIPEIIGETGQVLRKKDIDALELLIRNLMDAKHLDKLGEEARMRIIENYSIELRAEALLNTVKN